MAEKKLLGREDVLKTDDSMTEYVEVDEWGGTVKVKGLTGNERDRYESSLVKGTGRNREVTMKAARAKLVVLGTIDEEGKQVFNSKDVAALGKKSAKALNRVANAIQKLSGLTADDMEELTGNSDDGQNEDSI